MTAIITLGVALIACLLNGGVEVKSNTTVRVGGKRPFAKKCTGDQGSCGCSEGAEKKEE